jgi:DNA-binding XRE family transcriptional regulator
MKKLGELIDEILWETRWSQDNLAHELGTAQGTISRIKNGADCLNSLGDKIRELHAKHCKKNVRLK